MGVTVYFHMEGELGKIRQMKAELKVLIKTQETVRSKLFSSRSDAEYLQSLSVREQLLRAEIQKLSGGNAL